MLPRLHKHATRPLQALRALLERLRAVYANADTKPVERKPDGLEPNLDEEDDFDDFWPIVPF